MESEDDDSINKISHPKEYWYEKRAEYWASKEPTLKSILGGYEESHLPDIKCSCELLNGLILSKQLNPQKALDCATGIGRVTENVLLNFINEIDLVDFNEKFIDKCKNKFNKNNKIKDIYLSPLQNFKLKKKYDLIWIQWCLENLEDEDISIFLNECYSHLNDDGKIIIKENLCDIDDDEKGDNDYAFRYSELDFSKQRSDAFYINLFMKNKFKIKLHFLNPNWPENMVPLCVYVLSKK